jgi:hypothetical protein
MGKLGFKQNDIDCVANVMMREMNTTSQIKAKKYSKNFEKFITKES